MSDSFQKIAHNGLVMGLQILEQKQELLKELARLREERDRYREALQRIANGIYKHGDGQGFGRTCEAPEIAKQSLSWSNEYK